MLFLRIHLIARLTLLETVRTRLFWLAGLLLLGALVLAAFAASLALTESREMFNAVLAALLRLGAVFLVAMTVVTAMVREFNDKAIDLFLSLPMARAGYYLGKLAGFALAALLVALLFTVVMMALGEGEQGLYWGMSLAAELVLIAAAALLFVFTLPQVTTALTAIACFYLLARSLAAFRLMAASDLLRGGANDLIGEFLQGVSWFLPALDRFTPTAWLVYGGGSWTEITPLLLETAIYLLFLIGAGLFDLHRKTF